MTENQQIAGSLDEVSRILAEQGANHFRVQAYRHAAEILRGMEEPVSAVLSREGLATGEAWLPVLHTTRGTRHNTALFPNTARVHELGKTSDWVVLFYDGDQTERQCTVITSAFGPLQGRRIVRGREAECDEFYRSQRPDSR